MVCYHPLYAIRYSNAFNAKTGKNFVKVIKKASEVKNLKLGYFNSSGTLHYGFLVGCGKCIDVGLIILVFGRFVL